ncbi:ependymin [Aulostomus maculatus]
MYAALLLFAFMCSTASTNAEHRQPCHSPNMTGYLNLMSLRGEIKAFGHFTYDSMGKKLRFTSNESQYVNSSQEHDLLMFFEEGIFYEIDSKNQSCEKKTLQSTLQPLDIPDDAKFLTAISVGNPSIDGEGIKLNIWMGSSAEVKGYSMSVTAGCLPLSSFYFSESVSVLISLSDVDNEIKDPDLLLVPPYCQGLPVEETPEGTEHSFLNEFI